jgi:D-beta-D-heptose 7-phosphate kinase / D-beta-D-heptose 1-phosphate adenosyltransferase
MESNATLKKEPENPAIIQVNEWRSKGLKIGFVNGCFDIIHAGHINLMNMARSQCDKLIVGVSSDEAIKKQKGKNRPIMNQDERAFIINGLAAVDMVLIITDDTPQSVLEKLKPDVVAKGMDYEGIHYPEKSFLESYGAKIIYAPKLNSSSTIISRCKKVLRNK